MAFFVVVILLLWPAVAFANAGLPMLAIVWPLSIPVFVPVVALESWVVQRALGVPWKSSLTQMVKANAFSTIIGIPLAWLASVVVEFLLLYLAVHLVGVQSYPPEAVGKVGSVILSAPWLGPFEEGSYWILPLATIVLLIPFFFASFWLEAWYVARTLCPEAPARGRKAVWNANLFSYLGLLVACLVWLVFGVVTNG